MTYSIVEGIEKKTPALLINKYIWEQFKNSDENFYNEYVDNGKRIVPIFPVNDPSAGSISWGSRPYIIYDNFVKARIGKDKYFYPVKSEQMLYSIRGADVKEISAMRHLIISALDREDAAAEDIHKFLGQEGIESDVRFQCVNAYQVTYMKDATNLDTTRTPYQTDLIVKFDYHVNTSYN